MATHDRVRIVIVGDSETGKTSFAELLAYGKASERPMSTIGCTTHAKLHEYKAGLPGEKTYFIELWDIGGSRGHETARSLFYNPVDGLILVHDLANRKSQDNLTSWHKEVMSNREGTKLKQIITDYTGDRGNIGNNLPMLVIGTKLDLIGREPVGSEFAEETNSDEINLDNTNNRSLAPGSSNSVKISRFLDRVIERKINGSATSPASPRDIGFTSPLERRRNYSPSRSNMPVFKTGHID